MMGPVWQHRRPEGGHGERGKDAQFLSGSRVGLSRNGRPRTRRQHRRRVEMEMRIRMRMRVRERDNGEEGRIGRTGIGIAWMGVSCILLVLESMSPSFSSVSVSLAFTLYMLVLWYGIDIDPRHASAPTLNLNGMGTVRWNGSG